MRILQMVVLSLTMACFVGRTGAQVGHDSPRLASEQGIYNVGTRTLRPTLYPMTAPGPNTIQVWYPTDATCAGTTSYTVSQKIPPQGLTATFHVDSPLCAVDGAAPAPGRFPLFVFHHANAAEGQDSQRVVQLPMVERLASHGFVVALALHPAGSSAKLEAAERVLDYLLSSSNPLVANIDEDRIGVGGLSAGGGTALGLAGGSAAVNFEADPRVKALVLLEPGPVVVLATASDWSTISVPLLLMRGNQVELTDGSVNQALLRSILDATVLASPTIEVFSPNAVHTSYVTGACDAIEAARTQAIEARGPSPEPLAERDTSNGVAAFAYLQWNLSDLQPPTWRGFGGGRNYCTRVGAQSGLDVVPAPNGDGLTDSPPFLAGGVDPKVLYPAPAAEAMIPVVNHYVIAFLEVYLAGNSRYHGALAPGYAKKVGPAQVTIYR